MSGSVPQFSVAFALKYWILGDQSVEDPGFC